MITSEIEKIRNIRAYPSVSILSPTHRTAPDNQQDPIRVKNLVTEATNRLLRELPKREVEPLRQKMDSLVNEIDWRYTQSGLALFVNAEFSARVDLPFSVQERVDIDENFAIRDLVFAMNRSPRYLVLVLSEKPTRLFAAENDRLHELSLAGFPMLHEMPGGTEPAPGGFGVQRAANLDEYDRKFFREVDEGLSQVLTKDPQPVVVVGVTRNLAFFNEVSHNKKRIAGTHEGSHDNTNPHDLGQMVWPIMQEAMAKERQQVLGELEEAIGAKRHAAGMSEVWQLAHEGRGHVLLVEEDFHYPARLGESGELIQADDSTEPEVMDDAVDDLIEAVQDRSGRVVFVDNGSLEKHNRVAMTLRY